MRISSLMALGMTILLAACSQTMQAGEVSSPRGAKPMAVVPPPPIVNEGTADYVWEEPMVDVVDVPPGLDPEGHYYRPGHREVLEIRQGRWRYYRGDEGDVRDGNK